MHGNGMHMKLIYNYNTCIYIPASLGTELQHPTPYLMM